jgi:hypothetical protein
VTGGGDKSRSDDESCCVVAADASVPSGGIFQAAAAALVFRRGRQEARVVSAAGRRMPPEVERFALQLGISAALAKGCQKLVVFSDSLPAVKSLFDVKLRSGQIFSLDACRAVGPWLAGDPFFFFFFFFSTIYYAALNRSPRQTIQNRVQPTGIYV